MYRVSTQADVQAGASRQAGETHARAHATPSHTTAEAFSQSVAQKGLHSFFGKAPAQHGQRRPAGAFDPALTLGRGQRGFLRRDHHLGHFPLFAIMPFAARKNRAFFR